MGFLEFLALGIHIFVLRLILYQVHFGLHFRLGFGVEPTLVFNMNRLKGESKLGSLVTNISSKV